MSVTIPQSPSRSRHLTAVPAAGPADRPVPAPHGRLDVEQAGKFVMVSSEVNVLERSARYPHGRDPGVRVYLMVQTGRGR